MEGKLIKIKLRNILSFGSRGEEVELRPLNVIIGQNASGKSNLVDVVRLLKSLPSEKGLPDFFSKNGGLSEWIWNSAESGDNAEITITLETAEDDITYALEFKEFYQRVLVLKETITNLRTGEVTDREDYIKISDVQQSYKSMLSAKQITVADFVNNFLPFIHIFQKITAFTDVQTSRKSETRKPQLPDSPNEFLEEDASNLSLVLNDLEHLGHVKDKIVENLRKFYPRATDYSVRILGGTVQLFIREDNLDKPISAMRLSNGTLHYLCLLSILCHPEPPPLICIEEPEAGLHPDILPTIAELLIDASKRTQLIVTTHSDILVSALSDTPEAVLVCEYEEENGTHFRRLEKDALKDWLEEYSLGELWLKGEIGGTRW